MWHFCTRTYTLSEELPGHVPSHNLDHKSKWKNYPTFRGQTLEITLRQIVLFKMNITFTIITRLRSEMIVFIDVIYFCEHNVFYLEWNLLTRCCVFDGIEEMEIKSTCKILKNVCYFETWRDIRTWSLFFRGSAFHVKTFMKGRSQNFTILLL